MFYKYTEISGFAYGPYVSMPDGTFLNIEHKDEYTYPIDGWYYFETEEEAKTFFNIND